MFPKDPLFDPYEVVLFHWRSQKGQKLLILSGRLLEFLIYIYNIFIYVVVGWGPLEASLNTGLGGWKDPSRWT